MLQRHSSRLNRLDQSALTQRLRGAVSYDRIAGYFRSSLFEVAGEALASVAGPVRIICNSDLDPQDLVTATAAQAALRRSWCAGMPEEAPPAALPRYRALYEALTSQKLEVRVLPDAAFGLIHGKAGVLRYADGTSTAFMGSVNESLSAWKLNYELLWEDNDPETVAWVQAEFDALWNDPRAVLAKIREEADEIEAELDSGMAPDAAAEVGDLLFALANLARHLKVDPEAALRRCNAKFERRFHAIETALAAEGRRPENASLEEMEALWQQAKRAERKNS